MEIDAAGGDGGMSAASGGDIETALPRKGGEAYLVWDDLTVVLPNFGHGPTKKLLHGLNGYAEPGRVMAIMGPSGSGKSTLLDALAGPLSLSLCLRKMNIFMHGFGLGLTLVIHYALSFVSSWIHLSVDTQRNSCNDKMLVFM